MDFLLFIFQCIINVYDLLLQVYIDNIVFHINILGKMKNIDSNLFFKYDFIGI